jgi:bacillithiol biosynthesis cysteine-adding enzyme BshC
MPVDVRRFPWIRRLAADYAYDFSSVAPFFAGDPADRAAWADAIARTQRHDRRREEIARVIAAQQERRQAPPQAREAGALLADRRTVAIVTDSKRACSADPVHVLKALTAPSSPNRSLATTGPAIAVFWIDAKITTGKKFDRTVYDSDLAPRTVSLPSRPGVDPAPVATVRLDDSILTALDELDHLLPATDFRSWLVAGLRRAYAPGVGIADAFGRWIETTLGERGLVVYDSSDPASKPIVSPVFTRELTMPGQTAKLASLSGSDLIARGYHAQVHAQDDSLALFHLENGRRAIRQQDGQFVVGDRQYPTATLVEQATTKPVGFSPNVLLRPIVQDTLFPTICYVAGPNELAYLGQLRNVYQHFGVPMPLMYPRASATLLDSTASRFLNKYKLPLEALQPRDEAALNDLLRTQIPPAVDESLTEAKAAVEAQMARIIQALPALDPTLEGAARSTLGRMQHDLQTLGGKVIQAAKRRHDTLRRQLVHAQALAFPGGHPQERTIGFVSFLNQYGPALIERLDEELPLDLGRHWIVTI